jgi:hypothetical protein
VSDDGSRALIAPYLGKPVEVACDGVIFDTGPETFSLRFADPAALRDALAEEFPDEMDMEPWAELVPIAAVRGPEWHKELAWVFLDWSDEDAPSVKVATHDNWSGDLALPSLAALLAGESAAADDDGDEEDDEEDGGD